MSARQTPSGSPALPGSQTKILEAQMLATLRRRLAWLYTATTGTILTICLFFVLLFFWREAWRQQLEQFDASYLSLLSRLQSDTIISDGWLAKLEAEQKIILHIEENGIPLRFQGAWSPPSSRDLLIGLGKEKAQEEGIWLASSPVSSQLNQSSRFTIVGPAGDRYYGKSAVFSTKNGVRGLCILGQKTPILKQLGPLLLLLCVLEPAALCLLFCISRRFVGRLLAPVQSSREKQARFIAAASHELRSPLAVIRASAEALCADMDARLHPPYVDTKKDPGPTIGQRDARKLCQAIDRECVRMSRLIEDMLLLASVDAGAWSLDIRPVDADTLLLEAYEAFAPLCRQKKVRLHLDLPEDPLPQIQADPQRLTQILSILLDNALTYTPSGRQIGIQAEIRTPSQDTRTLAICIWNEGPQIPDRDKERIFERFYQSDPSRQDKQHFGLGLCIARELAAIQGGDLTARDHPGGGALFRLRIPTDPVCSDPKPYGAERITWPAYIRARSRSSPGRTR